MNQSEEQKKDSYQSASNSEHLPVRVEIGLVEAATEVMEPVKLEPLHHTSALDTNDTEEVALISPPAANDKETRSKRRNKRKRQRTDGHQSVPDEHVLDQVSFAIQGRISEDVRNGRVDGTQNRSRGMEATQHQSNSAREGSAKRKRRD